jgi:hypothetical protein
MEPGFYCGTKTAVYPVSYVDIPNVRIFEPWKFVKALQTLKPGWRIYGEFNCSDVAAWERIPDRLKRI